MGAVLSIILNKHYTMGRRHYSPKLWLQSDNSDEKRFVSSDSMVIYIHGTDINNCTKLFLPHPSPITFNRSTYLFE